ncbi:PA14 domain-containing protein [Nocardia sp. NPDC050435]|uniref:PA14 domain-containing protein n=1 Tax=Nocardia sp. NPDC050435 TaxID=3155040 RepID=UPI0034074FA1
MIATLIQVVVTPEASAAPKGKNPREVPLMLSKATSKQEAKRPASPVADFTPLLDQTKAVPKKSGFDPKTSKESARTENSVEFTNTNGTKTMVLAQNPISVRNRTGGWDPVDTRLVENKDSKRATPVRSDVSVDFAEFANDPKLFRVNQDGTPISLELKGARKAGRKIDGSTATYADALPGADLTYEVSAGAIKESIILKSASAVGDGRWEFTLNTGDLTPKVDGDTVKISDKAGKVVAALPPIEVWDSAASKDKPSSRTGGTYSLRRDGEGWQLVVAVDKKWLKDSARKFPIVVDPTYTYGFGTQAQQIVYSKRGTAAPQGCSSECVISTGTSKNFLNQYTYYRSAFRFNYQPLFGKNITGARLDVKLAANIADQKPASQVNLYEAGTPAGYDALGPQLASISLGEAGAMQSEALTTSISNSVKASNNNTWFMLTGTETTATSFKNLVVALVVDYGDGSTNPDPTPGPAVNPVAPVEDSVIATDTPTLEVGAGAAGTKYCFKISTGFDGRSGAVVDSGCLTTPKWTVPVDVLRDGGRYSWTVYTVASGATNPTLSNWVRHFTVDKRIGRPGPAPSDQHGPVTVNMFNGNASTAAAGPVFETLGGSAGVTFTYNSRQSGEGNGVRASYYNDSDHNGTPDATPVMVRSEPQVNLDWGTIGTGVPSNLPWKEDPMPAALDKQWFVIRWEGYFRAQVTGDFSFAGSHADGAKIWVDNKLVYDNPNAAAVGTDFSTATAKKTTDVSMIAGQRLPIKVEMYHRSTEKPKMVLWAKSTVGTTQRSHNWAPRMVTTEWLFAQDPSPLPGGWTLGLMGSKYVEAEMLDGSIILTDTTGGKHTWAKASEGGYTPPKTGDGVLAIDAGGRISVTESGVVSVFNVDGTLAAVSSVADSKKPASLQYLYSGAPARLTQIKDPVTGRAHVLHYNIDNNNNCYGGASFPPGTNAAPSQKLCRITYWDGTETRLWYIVGALGRIENPGSEITDYSYVDLAGAKNLYDQAGNDTEKKLKAIDMVGQLNEIRDSLAVDWRATQSSFYGNPERWMIEYSAFLEEPQSDRPPHSRAVSVTAPHPQGSSADGAGFYRTRHIYRYDIAQKKAFLDIGGLGTKQGVRTVTWDAAGRQLTSANSVGDTTSSEWNAKDQLIAQTDATGRRSTVVYDRADRPTDHFGPAPAGCFNGQLPKSECAQTMPHTNKKYDEALNGLEAAFYDNPYLAGVPKEWATGVGTGDGTLNRNWGSNPPISNANGWSARFTGEINLAHAGEYKLGFTVVDGARLWIDDLLVLDSWTDKGASAVAGAFNNTAAGTWHRIRIDYYNRNGSTGGLDFKWALPGSGAMQTVPGQNLQPRYGLQTSSVSHNATERAPSKKISTDYSDPTNGIDPVLGLSVSVTSDPGGTNLTTRRVFEKPGDGFLRQVAANLPAGDLSDPDKRGTSVYYGDNETRANPCDPNSSAVHQGGRVKAVRGAKNSDGAASVLETVYNVRGLIVAARTNSEPWSCVGYDSRGRTVKKTFPAMGDQPARVINYDLAVSGDPLKQKVSDGSGSTSTLINLHRQVVSYTDTNGATTTTAYDSFGLKTSETSTVKGITSTLAYTWDDALRLAQVKLDGSVVAAPAYAAGVVSAVSYANNSNLAITHNDAGSAVALKWRLAGGEVTSAVTRDRDQRILDESVTDTASPGSAYNYSYTYDSVGRLVGANVPFHQLAYRFDAENGCGTNTKAGLNTNRTSFVDSFNGAAPTVTNYCYDDADRLLSTNGATALSFTYDQYGNATKVGTDTLEYDSTLRHISTRTAAGNEVVYTRDVNDRIVARTAEEDGKPTQVTRYGFVSNAGSPDFVLDSSGALRQRVLKLPGGVVLTKSYFANQPANWSYPNIHGDILLTADQAANRTGSIRLYDPYGQNIDPVTGHFGDIPLPATAEGGMDFGYLGSHAVPIEHIASQQTIEMGDRSYLPILGRFLQVDPVLGGSANAYDYCNADPINSTDLTGRLPVIAPLVVPAIELIIAGVLTEQLLDPEEAPDPKTPGPDATQNKKEESEIVTIYKAPYEGQTARIMLEGFRASDYPGSGNSYPDGKAYFGVGNNGLVVALQYAGRGGYDGQIIAVHIPKSDYDRYFKQYESYEDGDPSKPQLAIPNSEIERLNQYPRNSSYI